MTQPKLSIIVPTMGRPSIERCVLSYLPQMHPGDELIVVGDEIDGPLIATPALLEKYAPLVRYVPTNHGEHSFGHREIGTGLDLARGDYILGNDDDDVATPNALVGIRAVISQLERPTPLLFKYRSYHGPIYWSEGGCLVEGQIGGHCLVTPNLPGRVGRYTDRYAGDYDMIMDTLSRWGTPEDPQGLNSALWADFMIAVARPQEPWADTTYVARAAEIERARAEVAAR